MDEELGVGDVVKAIRRINGGGDDFKSFKEGELATIRELVQIATIKEKYLRFVGIYNPIHDYGAYGKFELVYSPDCFELVAKKREPYAGAVYDFKDIAKRLGGTDWGRFR